MPNEVLCEWFKLRAIWVLFGYSKWNWMVFGGNHRQFTFQANSINCAKNTKAKPKKANVKKFSSGAILIQGCLLLMWTVRYVLVHSQMCWLLYGLNWFIFHLQMTYDLLWFRHEFKRKSNVYMWLIWYILQYIHSLKLN